MTDSPAWYILIPVYNGAPNLKRFIDLIPEPYRAQCLIINDGSIDNTGEILFKSGFRYLEHPTNRGKGAALKTGLTEAVGNAIPYCITIDADRQHPPDHLNKFIAGLKANAICIGYRHSKKSMPVHRRISNFMTSLLISVRTNRSIKDSQCGYRAFPTNLLVRFAIREDGFQFESEFLIKAGLLGVQINHIPIPTIYDRQPSAIHPFRDTFRFTLLWLRSFFWV